MEKRCRNFSLVTYLKEDDLLKVLKQKEEYIKAYAYCIHDRDEGKQVHTHVILLLTQPRYPSTVKKWFYGFWDEKNELINTMVQKCHSVTGDYEYLIHKGDPDKFQYDPCLRICSDTSYFSENADNDDIAKLALFDMLAGIPLTEIANRYGRDFIYHYGHIKQVYDDIVKQER